MTATNHVLTGMVIASAIPNPAIALPAALLSHFLMDALPHYTDPDIGINSFKFKLILGADAYIAAMCLLLVFMLQPANMWVIIAGGILAAAPDLMWLPDFIAALKHEPAPVYGSIRQFHHRIQWWAKPAGAYVEAVWFVVAFFTAFAYTI